MGMRYYNLTKQNEAKNNSPLRPTVVKEDDEKEKKDHYEHHKEDDENEWEEKMDERRIGANEKLPHEQLMRAINAFAIGCDFHENASLDSHKLGLQGFKRLHRYFSRKDNESKMKLEHYCIDMFGEKVMPDWDKLEKPKMSNTVKEMLESYLEHETEKYATIAEIANILTMNEFLHESHMLRKELEPVTREIIKCKRYIQDFENSDWSWHHIRYIDNMLHTKYKEKECEEFDQENFSKRIYTTMKYFCTEMYLSSVLEFVDLSTLDRRLILKQGFNFSALFFKFLFTNTLYYVRI